MKKKKLKLWGNTITKWDLLDFSRKILWSHHSITFTYANKGIEKKS